MSGLAASVALAVGLGVSHATDGTHALFAGLIGATATLVVDGTWRAESRFRLRDMVESADWLPGAVASLAASSRRIVDRYAEPEIVAEARRRLRVCAEEYEELARGRIIRPPDDYDLLLAGTRGCHRRLSAITAVYSDAGGLRWWRGDTGRRYWRADLDALSRGVAVTRIFVCDVADPDLRGLDPDLAALITEQSQAGVRTMVAPRELLSPGLLPPTLVIWDGRRAWQAWAALPDGDGPALDGGGPALDGGARALDGGRFTFGGDGRAFGNIFTVNEQDLRHLVAAFATCAGAARSVDE